MIIRCYRRNVAAEDGYEGGCRKTRNDEHHPQQIVCCLAVRDFIGNIFGMRHKGPKGTVSFSNPAHKQPRLNTMKSSNIPLCLLKIAIITVDQNNT